MATDPPGYGTVISDNITAVRARLKLKQSDVAARMSALGFPWHPQTVGQIEKASRRVTAEEVLGLALVLETSIDRLLVADDDQAVCLPSGDSLRADDLAALVYGLADDAVTWKGNKPTFQPGSFVRSNAAQLVTAIRSTLQQFRNPSRGNDDRYPAA